MKSGCDPSVTLRPCCSITSVTGSTRAFTRPSGKILEDERIFGCVQIGIGATELGSPVHSDGVVLKPSVWLDNQQIQADGVYVDPEIAALTNRLMS